MFERHGSAYVWNYRENDTRGFPEHFELLLNSRPSSLTHIRSTEELASAIRGISHPIEYLVLSGHGNPGGFVNRLMSGYSVRGADILEGGESRESIEAIEELGVGHIVLLTCNTCARIEGEEFIRALAGETGAPTWASSGNQRRPFVLEPPVGACTPGGHCEGATGTPVPNDLTDAWRAIGSGANSAFRQRVPANGPLRSHGEMRRRVERIAEEENDSSHPRNE